MAVEKKSLKKNISNIDDEQKQKLTLISKVYPELANPKKAECFEILKRTEIRLFTKQTTLMTVNSKCHFFILLLEGIIRIYQVAKDGREVSLYRIEPGDVCIMSLNSLINNIPFNASVQCETNVKAMMINRCDFYRALEISDNFRNLVLKSLTSSVSELNEAFYHTAFDRFDMRLACLMGRLFERSNSETIQVTHQELAQELAQELGTTREVISRLLKQFEQQDCISLARGRITIKCKPGLDGFANP